MSVDEMFVKSEDGRQKVSSVGVCKVKVSKCASAGASDQGVLRKCMQKVVLVVEGG